MQSTTRHNWGISEKEIFFESVKRWILRLNDFVQTTRLKDEKDVVLVAISRKMPRFVQVMLECQEIDSTVRDALKEIVDKTDYVTEHALPFVLVGRNRPFEIVVIDDTAVFGNTIKKVADDIVEISGLKPIIYPVFQSFEADFGYNVKGFLSMPYESITQRNIQSFHRMVDKLVGEKALPIDVEFPIFRYSGYRQVDMLASFDRLLDEMEWNGLDGIEGSYSFYESKGNLYSNGICIDSRKQLGLILDRYDTGLKKSSFSKLRFFREDTKMTIACFSPYELTDSRLRDDDIFTNPAYNAIWRLLLKNLYWEDILLSWKELSDRVAKTLVVWANYLLSIAKYIQFVQMNYLEINDFKIEYEDVRLLVGSRLAKRLIDKLNRLILDDEMTSIRVRVFRSDLPNKIVPKDWIASYETIRTSAWASGVGKSIGDTLDNLFESMDYSRGKLAKRMSTTEQSRYGFYETMDSLNQLLNLSPGDGDISRSLNEWIDKNVDNGIIVPSYQPIRNTDGQRWWKRCFTNSKSAVEL